MVRMCFVFFPPLPRPLMFNQRYNHVRDQTSSMNRSRKEIARVNELSAMKRSEWIFYCFSRLNLARKVFRFRKSALNEHCSRDNGKTPNIDRFMSFRRGMERYSSVARNFSQMSILFIAILSFHKYISLSRQMQSKENPKTDNKTSSVGQSSVSIPECSAGLGWTKKSCGNRP